MNDRKFYINFNYITMNYPSEVSKLVNNFGVLEQYKDKKYTLKEINNIIAELVVKTPYINNSMQIKLSVMNGGAYHHTLVFKNYEYNNQNRSENTEIGFLY